MMTEPAPRVIWKEILIGALMLWIALANLASSLDLYIAHRGTLKALFLLACECGLMVGSATAIALGAGPVLRRQASKPGTADDSLWQRLNVRRLRRLALLSFLGLAWCLGSLR